MAAVGVILLLAGGVHLLFPRATWYLSIGWKIADAEPSDDYLALTRVGGGIAVGVGIILMVIGFIHAG